MCIELLVTTFHYVLSQLSAMLTRPRLGSRRPTSELRGMTRAAVPLRTEAAIYDEERHARDASLAVLLGLHCHRFLVFKVLNVLPRRGGVQADLLRRRHEPVLIWEDPVGEILPEDHLLKLVLDAMPCGGRCIVEQGVALEGVGRSVRFPGEVDAHCFACSLQPRSNARVPRSRGLLRRSLLRDVRAELERVPTHFHPVALVCWEFAQRLLQISFPNPAPRAQYVRHDVDHHGLSAPRHIASPLGADQSAEARFSVSAERSTQEVFCLTQLLLFSW
eukprot:CAMPEP_0117662280 /NCGR_PEP_ID=MMETSP0804-20121206/7972_1 /TAXON_ID=1074897 /ORGANISM="Tetraselmis astigmatica, Strain CCMP880" /LENGTH=275 /DNA_ID=CAMNT_0005469175 /DNA_START=158 /DNA_END=983 /DNA_ORIENTATION=-